MQALSWSFSSQLVRVLGPEKKWSGQEHLDKALGLAERPAFTCAAPTKSLTSWHKHSIFVNTAASFFSTYFDFVALSYQPAPVPVIGKLFPTSCMSSHCPVIGFKLFMSQILSLVQKPGTWKKGKIPGRKGDGNVVGTMSLPPAPKDANTLILQKVSMYVEYGPWDVAVVWSHLAGPSVITGVFKSRNSSQLGQRCEEGRNLKHEKGLTSIAGSKDEGRGP